MSAPQNAQMPKVKRLRSSEVAAIAVAAILGVVVAGLVIVFIHVHAVSRNQSSSQSGVALTETQNEAITAASTEAIDVLSFSRKNFAADFQRALNGATGKLKSDLSGKRSVTLEALTDGKFDLSAQVATPGALAGYSGKDLLVLVTVNGFKTADDASQNSSSVQRLEMTMQLVHGKWLAADLNAVGIQ
jgi:hypothetical protein